MREGPILRQLAWREIYARRKVFALTTGALAVVVSAAMIFGVARTDDPKDYTILHTVNLPVGFEEILASHLEDDTVVTFEAVDNLTDLKAALEEKDADAGVTGPLYAYWGPSAPWDLRSAISSTLTATNLQQTALDLGLSTADLQGLLATAEGEFIVETGDEAEEVLAAISVILSFVAIIAYGQWVAYGVVEEKNNRIIEIILGTASARQVMWAKILSIGSLGLTQFLVVVGLAVGIGLTMEEIPLPEIATSAGAWLILWFILGYGFYAALFAAAGSLAENSQEASSTIGPLAILPGLGYMFALPMLTQPLPPTALWVLAFAPPWAPLVVPAMLARGWMSPALAALSAVVVAAAVFLVVRLAARIYAGGVTQSTRTLGWRDAFRAGSDLLR